LEDYEVMVKALIFNGTGVGQTCLPRTTDALIKYNIPFATSTKINKDTLKGYNVLFLPGGDSAYKLYITNKNINSTDIKAWIKSGGVVIATCSGAYASVNNVDGLYRAFGFAPNVNAKVYSENGVETVQFTTQGQKVFKKGTTLKMSHEAGPALYLPPGPGKEVLAIYNTGSFKGYGAIVVDGNVGLFSPHPELNPYYPDMIVNLMNYLLKKNEGNDVMGNIDTKYDYMIKKADFKLMIEGVANWLKSHSNKPPVTVYLRVNGVKSLTNYVSYAKYVEMKKKWDNFIKLNKREPAYVTPRPSAETITPTPTPNWKGTAWLQFEKACGKTFKNFTEIYQWILKNTDYSYYLDDKYTWQQELDRKLNYLNCVDMCQALMKIAKSGGYTVVPYGVYCPTYRVNHAIFLISGKEFTDEKWVDGAAAASDNYPLGQHWCNGAKTKRPGWIPEE
jgi:putative intracellular protease/amidase